MLPIALALAALVNGIVLLAFLSESGDTWGGGMMASTGPSTRDATSAI